MHLKPFLVLVSGILLLVSAGCRSVPDTRTPAHSRTPPPAPSPLRTELLLLNIAEASGWVAFTESDSESVDTEDYRIIIQRESTGEILFQSSIPLARGLRTHGFEMSREDARLIQIASAVDTGILPPLSLVDAGRSTSPTVPPHSDAAEAPLAVLTGIQVIDATENTLVLEMESPGLLQTGDRIFVRTPPETMQDPETGALLILSRGRIAGLLEITEQTETRAIATLLSGELPPEGYLERVEPDL